MTSKRHTLILLASGRIPDELLGDVGPTDVAWLPFGGRPLLRSIVEAYSSGTRVVITVPPGRASRTRLLLGRFEEPVVIECDPSSSLADVASVALEHAGLCQATLVFGDTLGPLPVDADEIQVSPVVDSARWTTVRRVGDEPLEFKPRGADDAWPLAVSGVFAISRPDEFLGALRDVDATGEAFFTAVTEYERRTRLRMAVRTIDDWYDFGHLDTFHESRRRRLQSRAFNAVSFVPERATIRKSSADAGKLRAEWEWFTRIAADVPAIVPRAVAASAVDGSYEIEYIATPTIAESYVCGALDTGYWQRLLQALGVACNYLHHERRPAPTPQVAESETRFMLVDKAVQRLRSLGDSSVATRISAITAVNGVEVPGIDEAIAVAASGLSKAIRDAPSRRARIHGDLFFGNLFFDRRSHRIVMIDPRGSFHPEITTDPTIGDPLYDLAKLSHSMLGGYDSVTADTFVAEQRGSDVRLELLRCPTDSEVPFAQLFSEWLAARADQLSLTLDDVRRAEALCFLSLLPLHAERPDRQLAFAAIALSIIGEIQGGC